MKIEVRLLSGFEVRVDGVWIEVQPAGQRLLAFVALNPRGVHRDFAAFQLWPDVDEARAKANLRSALWRLRKETGAMMRATKTSLRIDEDVWLDVRDGLDELGDMDDAALDPAPFGALLGDLLPDWYDDWLVVERERLRQDVLRALERRSSRALLSGDTASAIQTGLAAVAIDPLRESAHRLVIEAHLAEGNRAEAIREYDRFSTVLDREFGVAPSPAMGALVGT